MKYYVNHLYVKAYCSKHYDENEEKFLIGHVNYNGDALRDVVTGQVVKSSHFNTLAGLRSHRKGGISGAPIYMTEFLEADETLSQMLQAKYIEMILNKDMIDKKDIIKIKTIMNSAIRKSHERKENALKKNLNKKNVNTKSCEKQNETILNEKEDEMSF